MTVADSVAAAALREGVAEPESVAVAVARPLGEALPEVFTAPLAVAVQEAEAVAVGASVGAAALGEGEAVAVKDAVADAVGDSVVSARMALLL